MNIALRSLREVSFSAFARHHETRYTDSYNQRSIVNSPTNRREPQQVIVAEPESIATLFPTVGGTCSLPAVRMQDLPGQVPLSKERALEICTCGRHSGLVAGHVDHMC